MWQNDCVQITPFIFSNFRGINIGVTLYWYMNDHIFLHYFRIDISKRRFFLYRKIFLNSYNFNVRNKNICYTAIVIQIFRALINSLRNALNICEYWLQ